ncbi:MAG: hypothetical protein E7401_05925 [Ruminococcaceae bacterium]|nr:hypothetical protein [Oscillospiraceae bacterium]
MNRKLKKLSVISVVLIFCFSGCSYKKTVERNEIEMYESNEEMSTQKPIEITNTDAWTKIGEEIRKLDDISGIDETAIMVNGQSITKKEIETQKIYAKNLGDKTLNDYIKSIIRDKVIKAEAVRLGIEPAQESIDEYLNQVDMALEQKAVGTETVFALMEGMKISKKEYLTLQEKVAYDMYQREALWKATESMLEGSSYDEYIDTLIGNADITVLSQPDDSIVLDQALLD